jgi:hypothetical protein
VRVRGITAAKAALEVLLGRLGLRARSTEFAADEGNRGPFDDIPPRLPAAGRVYNSILISICYMIKRWPKRKRYLTPRGLPTATSIEVLFRQHPAENCISDCSNCLFVVACRNM